MTEFSDDHLYGVHPLLEALKAGKSVEKVLLKKGLSPSTFREIRKELSARNIPFQVVGNDSLNRISRKNHQGVIAFASPIEYQNIEEILARAYEAGESPLLLVLDGITDTRNMGAIARTALCAGVHALVVPQKHTARMGSDALKSSAGALTQLPVCRASSLTRTIHLLHASGLQVFTASEKADTPYYEADLRAPAALVMGSEEKGIRREVRHLSDQSLRIPLQGPVQSLNVSVACGILLFEILKQRWAGSH